MRAATGKSLTFVVISFLVVTLVYASSTTSIVFSVPPDVFFLNAVECESKDIAGTLQETCCWEEYDENDEPIRMCQTCAWLESGNLDCSFIFPEGAPPPPPQPIGPSVPLQDGVLQQQPPSEEGEGGAQPLTRGEGVLPPADQGAPETPTGEEAKSPFPTSPTGGCISTIRTHCVPCDPGLPVGGCTPESEWSPVLSTDIDTPQATEPPDAPLSAPLVGEKVPEAEQPSTDEATEQASIEALPTCPEGQVLVEESGLCVPEDCPEGQVLDEEAGLCVLEEPEVAQEEPEQSEPEGQEQSTEEGDGPSEDNGNN